MAVSRRTIIAGAGATTLALVGGAGWWRVSRTTRTAMLPWALERQAPSDVRLDTFRHAILAPNPHNRQPWLIRLEGSDRATIYCDMAKRLPDTDPFDRQITIGFGTFLELARIAAAERGARLEIESFPEGEPLPWLDDRPIASLRFVPDPALAKDPLFSTITARRTNRQVFDVARPLSASTARQIAEGAYSLDAGLIAQVRTIAVAAITIEITTPRTWRESVELMRIGAKEIDASPDGLSLQGPLLEALNGLGVLNRPTLADPSSLAFGSGLEMQREICGSIPALMWITTRGNSRRDQLEAGRRYVRANLRATKHGVAMHPLSQALQEYPEMAANFAKVHDALDARPGERLQMLARMGYAPAVAPSPRWPLESHLRS